jgi:transcriptional regulator with XRE-family HTH domain
MYPNLKLQLFKSGMRQNRLAQCLGVDESILSKIVNGYREPSRELRARIASLLGSEEEWLFERVNPPGVTEKNGGDGAPAPASMRSTRSNGGA